VKVVAVSVTAAGAMLAERLPFEHVHGHAGAAVRERWADADAFVLFLATGAAVRIVGPLLTNKRTDPAVVCVDDSARFAIVLCGGHAAGGNALARHVGNLLGSEPVVTTATDTRGLPALDTLPGFVADGDIAGVTVGALDGRPPAVDNPLGWPLPASLVSGPGPARVVVTDAVVAPQPGVAVLHPPSLVVGVGASSDAPAEEVTALVASTLADAGLAWESVAAVATIDRRLDAPGVVALGLPVQVFTAEQLSAVNVPNPSEAPAQAVGTPSVAEAAALLAAGEGGQLIVPKHKNAVATVAVARRRRPPGHLSLVGLGPGDARHRTPAADAAVRHADVVIGYGPYVDQCADLLSSGPELVRSPIGDEVVRAKEALAAAAEGRRVALVCSGDAGVYAMASIALELAPEVAPGVDIDVVPGVTAALAAAAAVGAPLGHDHVSISLSDLLTPWTAIERRLRAAADGDFVVALYNPRSRGRDWQLPAALSILAGARPPTTPVAVVTDAARAGQQVVLTTLADVDPATVGMTTIVVVGSSATRVVGGRMVTPRGYQP
jgi:cobalt-precorrin 5A hydrolase/precorrin-3B C17-methyltransferase